MKKVYKRIIIAISIFTFLVSPLAIHSYEFEDSSHNSRAHSIRQEIYDLYDAYKEIVSESDNQFGIIGYNGVCSMVNVDGTTVPLESYVAGVVKAEMGSESDNPEVLKAQAIAARSFLLASKKNASDCTVTNGQSYQAYRAIDANSASDKPFIDAAKATEFMVVKKDGEIANTMYLSYPNDAAFCTEDSSGWHVKFQRFSEDSSTAWTWNGPAKATVLAGNNYASRSGAPSTTHHFGMSQTIAGYLTRKENYTYQKVIELFYGEEIATIADGIYDGDIEYVGGAVGNVVYWNQGDFANYDYGHGCGSIAACGCGPTSVAIVASTFLNRSISPVETTANVCAVGGCYSSGSSFEALAQTLNQYYNIRTKWAQSDQEVINELGTGRALVIALMGPGTFTSGGHYIVLTGVNTSGQVSVADPASRARTNTKWFSFNLVTSQRKAAFLIAYKP
jgi:hypothetical protein